MAHQNPNEWKPLLDFTKRLDVVGSDFLEKLDTVSRRFQNLQTTHYQDYSDRSGAGNQRTSQVSTQNPSVALSSGQSHVESTAITTIPSGGTSLIKLESALSRQQGYGPLFVESIRRLTSNLNKKFGTESTALQKGLPSKQELQPTWLNDLAPGKLVKILSGLDFGSGGGALMRDTGGGDCGCFVPVYEKLDAILLKMDNLTGIGSGSPVEPPKDPPKPGRYDSYVDYDLGMALGDLVGKFSKRGGVQVEGLYQKITSGNLGTGFEEVGNAMAGGQKAEKTGGHASAAIGSFAAALGGPIGAAGMMLARLAETGFKAIGALRTWNEELRSADFQFSEFSSGMSQVRANSEMNYMQLSQERGDRRAASAGRREQASFALDKQLAVYEDAIDGVKSGIATWWATWTTRAIAGNRALGALITGHGMEASAQIVRDADEDLAGIREGMPWTTLLDTYRDFNWSSTYGRPPRFMGGNTWENTPPEG